MIITDGSITLICQKYRILAGAFNKMVRGPRNPIMRRQGLRYVKWCNKNKIDPILFMEDRIMHAFSAKHELPLLGRLCSQASLEVHRNTGASRTLAERADRKLEIVDSRHADRRLRIHQERFKQLHSNGKQEICARLPEHSGGYQPVSAHCKHCVATASCISFGRL